MSDHTIHQEGPELHQPAPDALLAVRGLHVEYQTRSGPFEALHDINFDLQPGQVVGVVGESGCGKSTLAAALMRLLPPNGNISSGEIRLEGTDLVTLEEDALRQVRGGRIGMIFQDPLTSLNPTFRVATQMVHALRAHGIGSSDHERREQAVTMLGRVGIPDAAERADAYPHEFSGGMRQRIMIATTLLLGPQILIADEATSALDVTLQAQILDLLGELCEERGTGVVLISHDLGVISSLSQRILVLYAGRVVEHGDLETTLQDPQHPYTRRLLAAVPSRHRRRERLASISGRVPSLTALPPGCTFANRCDYAQAVCDDGEPALFATGEGRGARCLIYGPDDTGYDKRAAETVAAQVEGAQSQPSPTPQAESEFVAMDRLQVYFGDRSGLFGRFTRREHQPVRAVDGVDLVVKRGEALGLVGESGSGKTTLGKALLGLTDVTGGSIEVNGQPVSELDRRAWRKLRRRMQMVFQEPYGSLSPRLPVAALVTEPYRIHRVPPAERYDVDELLSMVGLSSEQAGKYPHQLSGGQARRVGIARALAVHPDFIVADEPTAGLDVSAAASVLNLLHDLRRDLGLTYLVITHDLNVVGYITDRIAVMYLGKVVEIGTPAQILDTPRHPYTQALLASVPDPAAEAHRPAVPAVGEIPSPRRPPSGCRFRTRCVYAGQRCADEVPELRVAGDGHRAACHFFEEIAAGTRERTR